MKIVVGGQINKKEIAQYIKDHSNAEVEIKNDLDGAAGMKAGKYDYYVGACMTGGGGALAMAMALLGRDLCQILSMPGKISSDEEIRQAVHNNKKAFGFTAQHAQRVLPVLIQAMIDKENEI